MQRYENSLKVRKFVKFIKLKVGTHRVRPFLLICGFGYLCGKIRKTAEPPHCDGSTLSIVNCQLVHYHFLRFLSDFHNINATERAVHFGNILASERENLELLCANDAAAFGVEGYAFCWL